MQKKILYFSIIAIALFSFIAISLYVGAHHVAPYAIIQPARFKAQAQFLKDSSFKSYEILARDGILLKTLILRSQQPTSRGTLLLLHGIAASKEQNISPAESFSQSGFDVVIFDLRAHGESGGKYCTYGYEEKRDVSDIITFLFKNGIADSAKPLGVIGVSLGGAIALQAMAEDKRISCGIVESTFSSLDDVVYDYLVRIAKLPIRWMSKTALHEAARIAGFMPDDVCPAEAARKITQPILYIHGTDDAHIPLWHGEKIFKNIASEKKEFLKIDKAEHFTVSLVGGENYKRKRAEFFKRYMP
ncbi:MAG TPA: alpha/beta hydrolase [Patescibacteria group bacterium]|nr:alpha/beta hydrolase [Patescibacteria group bacterium]